jgi:hypothetical protein
MIIDIKDYNHAQDIVPSRYKKLWRKVEQVLDSMPLHLKASSQRGKVGAPIFDPIGTNQYIKDELSAFGWSLNVPIPPAFRFLGKDVDFAKSGVLAEVQFSNYPSF